MPVSAHDLPVSVYHQGPGICVVTMSGDIREKDKYVNGPMYDAARTYLGTDGRAIVVIFEIAAIREPFKFVQEIISRTLPLAHLSEEERGIIGVRILRELIPGAFF